MKEKWLQFQIKTLEHHGYFPFQNYRKFIDFCIETNMEEWAKLEEFYMHNLILTDMNIWDPNSRLGDMQLMALASWVENEEIRVEEFKRLMRREEK